MYIYELIHDHAVYACSVDRYVKVTQGQADITYCIKVSSRDLRVPQIDMQCQK